jgi:hypothetical protein
MREGDIDTIEEVDDRLFLALGRAASRLWSDLPQEFQQRLFEEAVMFRVRHSGSPSRSICTTNTSEQRTP